MISPKNQSFALLVLEYKKGNRKAFQKLFELFWEPMFIKANAIVQNESASKDIVQEIWITLWNQREVLTIVNLEAYIQGAVKNGCFKYFRDNKFNKVGLEVINELHYSSLLETEHQYELEEVKSRLGVSMQKLPKRCKQIFELSRFEEFSNDEIASHLGISKRSVENQISLALKSIKHSLFILLFFSTQ